MQRTSLRLRVYSDEKTGAGAGILAGHLRVMNTSVGLAVIMYWFTSFAIPFVALGKLSQNHAASPVLRPLVSMHEF